MAHSTSLSESLPGALALWPALSRSPRPPAQAVATQLSSLPWVLRPPSTHFFLQFLSRTPKPRPPRPTFPPGSCEGCHPGDPACHSQGCWPVSHQMGWVGSQTQRKGRKDMGALEPEGAEREQLGHSLRHPSDSTVMGRPSRLGHGQGAVRGRGVCRGGQGRLTRGPGAGVREKGGVQSPEGR